MRGRTFGSGAWRKLRRSRSGGGFACRGPIALRFRWRIAARGFRRNITRKSLRILRSEEHTSELQSHSDLVCRLLLEKKKKTNHTDVSSGKLTLTPSAR